MRTIIVTEAPTFWSSLLPNIGSVEYQTPLDYLSNPPHGEKNRTSRVINLASNYSYQALGYYVSLLGQARGDKVFPSVLTIQDFNTKTSKLLLEMHLKDEIQKTLKPITSDIFELSVYFGKNLAKHYDHLCQKFYGVFPMPLFRVFLKRNQQAVWHVSKVVAITVDEIPESHHPFVTEVAQAFFEKKRLVVQKQKKVSCSVAMLVDPNEKTPPSDPDALQKFIKAGEKLGIEVVPIQKEDAKTIAEYDGLFIRTTTAVNDYTYQIARRALAEGLYVIDDPTSILRCANKVYLAELLKSNNILTPQTTILVKNLWREQIAHLQFPLIIKVPDSAFSLGVVKAVDEVSCREMLEQYFKSSELLIAQAFMPSDFDWRIGILANEPIFACRYYMAKNHWQIYNWDAGEEGPEGAFDTVPLTEVPQAVLQAALKASRPIGEGLYGVDIKYIDDKAYVIEVNDNPNIDSEVEDLILGDALYTKIMETFLNRIRRKFHRD